jgi:hypothetical protein
MKKSLPTVDFCGIETSRLIIGSNPFCGKSHYSEADDRAMRAYFDDERILNALFEAEAEGLTVFQMRGDERFTRIAERYFRAGGRMKWFTQNDPSILPYEENIRAVVAAGASAVYLHGTVTDRLYDEGRLDEIERLLTFIHDTGVPTGLGTHMPEVITYAERTAWPIDFYMASLFNLSRPKRVGEAPLPSENGEAFFDGDRARMLAAIRATEKPCLVLKILGAGRLCLTPEDTDAAFRAAFAAIKPQDCCIVGIYNENRNQLAEDAELVRKYSSLSV